MAAAFVMGMKKGKGLRGRVAGSVHEPQYPQGNENQEKTAEEEDKGKTGLGKYQPEKKGLFALNRSFMVCRRARVHKRGSSARQKVTPSLRERVFRHLNKKIETSFVVCWRIGRKTWGASLPSIY